MKKLYLVNKWLGFECKKVAYLFQNGCFSDIIKSVFYIRKPLGLRRLFPSEVFITAYDGIRINVLEEMTGTGGMSV